MSRSKIAQDLILSQYNLLGSEIINLQTALFSTITAGIISFVVGLFLGLKNFVEVEKVIFTYPIVHIVPLSIWLVATMIVAEATFIFISAVQLGYKKKLILEQYDADIQLSQDEDNFVLNSQPNFLLNISTSIYFPALSAQGYSHNFFPPLFVLTPVLGIVLSVIHYIFLCHAAIIDKINLSFMLKMNNFVISYPCFCIAIIFLMYMLVCFLIVPLFTPGTYNIIPKAKGSEILLVTETLRNLSGTHIVNLGLVNEAKKNNFNIHLVGPVEKDGIELYEYCIKNSINISQLPSMNAWFLGQPDFRLCFPLAILSIIHKDLKAIYISGFPGPLSLLTLILCKIKHIPLIFIYQVYLPKFIESIPIGGKNKLLKRLINKLILIFVKCTDITIVPSFAIAKELKNFGLNSKKLQVIPSGVDCYFCQDVNEQDAILEKDNFSSPMLLYAGRLSQEKNVIMLIEALSIVLYSYPQAHLVIAGLGPEKRKIDKRISELDVIGSVTFVGHVGRDKLIKLYHAADIFCVPSHGETQGLVIQEAKACGALCVVLNACGSGEQITHLKDGILVDNEIDSIDLAEEYAASIIHVLKEPMLSQTLSTNAKINARQRTLEHSSREILEVYKKINNPNCHV